MLFVVVQNALITDIYLYILDIDSGAQIWYIVYIINYRRFTIMNIKGRVLGKSFSYGFCLCCDFLTKFNRNVCS